MIARIINWYLANDMLLSSDALLIGFYNYYVLELSRILCLLMKSVHSHQVILLQWECIWSSKKCQSTMQ